VALGIWLADACTLEPGPGWVGALLLFIPVLAAGRLHPRYRVLVCLPWFLVGIEVQARVLHVHPGLDVGRLASPEGRLVALRGRVSRGLIRTRHGGVIEIDADEAGLPWRRVGGRITVFLTEPGRARSRRGDQVEARGRLRTFRPAGNPGERDHARAARRRGIRARLLVKGDNLIVLDSGAKWNPFRRLDDLRFALSAWAGARMNPREAGLFRALLLGDRRALDERFQDDFRRGGLLHFLAISGLHVALVAGGLRVLLRRAGVHRGPAAGVALLVLFAQAGLAEFRTPVVRAAVLAGGVFVAPTLVRAADPWNLMAAAALVTLLLRPADLFSPGFGLSYGAVAAILLYAGRLDPAAAILAFPGDGRLRRAGKRTVRAALGVVALTLAAWLGSGPILWEVFGTVHPWIPASNLLVMPVFVVTLGAALLTALTAPLGFLSWLPLTAFTHAAGALDATGHWVAALPAASVPVPPVGRVVLIGIYGLLFALRHRALGLLLVIPAILVVASAAATRPPHDPEVTVLDVGQGLSVFVSAGPGRSWLYDAGSSDVQDVTGQLITPFLRTRGVRRVETCFLSHAEHDHASGLHALARSGRLGRVVSSVPVRLPDGVAVELAAEGRAGSGASPGWRVLHPPPGATAYLTSNDSSLVVLLEIAGIRVLLPGDVEEAGLVRLVRTLERPVDVLVMPHHGGWAENLPEFLASARPRLILVSARRGFPSARTLRLLDEHRVPVLFTWKHGALTVTGDERALRVVGFRGGALRISRAWPRP
jgi:competence protein ComEC